MRQVCHDVPGGVERHHSLGDRSRSRRSGDAITRVPPASTAGRSGASRRRSTTEATASRSTRPTRATRSPRSSTKSRTGPCRGPKSCTYGSPPVRWQSSRSP
ncbi:hypothetical protein CKY47_15915 [Saccharothrix yanglingensis]|uniref:Uncharacterized protein n=1 Tax=Saccharothrix yanglingensis TaxID=659496 RepID=A0ABU0X121_9PSEU|nr:hypothetical protein [Saccharothrix yanglingensis]